MVSTAALHARVRGSVPGLGGLKETKLFLPHPRVKVSIVGSLRDREVACSASDRQGSNFESCVWRTVSSQSSHHPQDVLLAQFSLYVHKGGLKPDSFHFSRSRDPELQVDEKYLYGSAGPDPEWGPRGEASDRIEGGARGARASHQEGRLQTGSRVGPEGPGHPTRRGGFRPDPGWGPRGPSIPPRGEASDRIQGGARGARASHQKGRLRTGSRVGPEGPGHPTKR